MRRSFSLLVLGTLAALAGTQLQLHQPPDAQQGHHRRQGGPDQRPGAPPIAFRRPYLQRQQALVSKPLEVVVFQSAIAGIALVGFAPLFLALPVETVTWRDIAISAVLSFAGAALFTWGYARAETQKLVPLEYSGFLWAALFGWVFFAEVVTGATIAGAALIVAGCWIATRGKPPEPEQTAL